MRRGRPIRVIGVDDAHYADQTPGAKVNLAGIVCGGTRFEGMLWGQTAKDGLHVTDDLIRMIQPSKFASQIHLVLLDGLTFGGCNIVDLPRLAEAIGRPAVAVMRRLPDMRRFKRVVDGLPDPEERWQRVLDAGPIHQIGERVFQVSGEDPEIIAAALDALTCEGKVPEPLRIAHLIGGAVMLGESTNRA